MKNRNDSARHSHEHYQIWSLRRRGVKQDGLVHVSQLADRFVSDPTEIVKLNQEVRVKVLEVDLARKRVAFTMKLGAKD